MPAAKNASRKKARIEGTPQAAHVEKLQKDDEAEPLHKPLSFIESSPLSSPPKQP